MKGNSILLLAVLLAVGVCQACFAEAPREVIFSDDFSDYAEGEAPAEKWSVFSGRWVVKDGTLHQEHGGFDHGLVVRDLYLRCDYRIETKVRLVGGGSGAGLYWNVYDAVTGETGNMLRYDGEFPIMYGWMRGRGFVGTGGATGNLQADNKWHTLRMDVNNSTGTFDVYWDGKKIVDEALSYHRSGYTGLQCSLGHCEFDDVKISVAKGTDWRASPKGVVTPEWIQSLALLPNGNIVYPVRNMHRIQIVTPDGKLVREFGKFGDKAGQLNLPTAVTTDTRGRIYVTESGNNRVQVFSSKGKSLAVLKPTGEDGLKQPFGVAVGPAGRIWVGDNGNNRLVALNADGTVAASDGSAGSEPGQFQRIGHLSVINGRLFVADRGNRRIQVFDPRNISAAPEIVPMAQGTEACAVDYDGKGTYVVSMWRGVATFDKNWKLLKNYGGDAAGEVWPYQSVFDDDGNILIGDWWGKRILIVSPDLTPVKPETGDVTSASAVVRWRTDLPTPTRLMLLDTPQGSTWPSTTDYSNATALGDGKLRKVHVVELKALKPATRYTYAIGSPRKMIPASGHSIDYRFATKPPAGMMAYTEARLAILCYSNVTFNSRKRADGTVPAPAIRDEKWFEQVIKNHEVMRYFYWTNSRFRLDTKCIYLRITRPVEFAYLGSSSEEVYKDLKTLADREGMKPEDFGAVLVVGGNGTYAYPWPTPWWGGNLTYTTGCCFIGGGDTWIATHEFHHLTEGWMRMVGAWGYTSADTPWVHRGRIGENYDFLAHTLRIMPDEAYLNLATGVVKITADKDGDSVPDSAPNTTFDEKRGGTSPDEKYSYKNGLTDLQNLTAEAFRPAVKGHKHPLLTKEINLKYPFAVFDYDYERKQKSPTIDGKLGEGEWDKFASTPNAVTEPERTTTFVAKFHKPPEGADYRMDSYLNWDDAYFYIALSAPYKFHVSVQLDCEADGYFTGNDNPRFGLTIPSGEPKTDAALAPPGVMVWNNVEPVAQRGIPNWTNDRFDKRDEIKWAWSENERGWYTMEVAIPKCEKVGLNLVEGEELGMRLWFSVALPPTEENKNRNYAFEMFESCEYAFFKLVK